MLKQPCWPKARNAGGRFLSHCVNAAVLALLVGSPVAVAGADPAATGAEAASTTVVYVSVSGEHRIATYRRAEDGWQLEPIGSVEVGGSPGSLAVGPEQKFLYAAVRSQGEVVTLAIDEESKQLKVVARTPVAGNPVYLAVDRTGKYLLTAYYSGNKVAIYPIAEDRTVLGEATQVIETGKNPHSIMIDAGNRFVLVPNTGADRILQFRFDAGKGRLTPAEPPAIETSQGAGPRHFCFHPSGKWVYVVNEKNSSVSAYQLDAASGTLSHLQTLPTLPADFERRNTCADIHLTPDGEQLFASNRGHDSLAAYGVNSETGKLTALGQVPTGKTPREFDIDPSGRYLYSAGQGDGSLTAYELAAGASTLPESQQVYQVGKSPAWVSIVRFE